MKILVLITLLLSTSSFAQTIKLATGEFPPFVGNELNNKGLATEIITRVFDEMGDQVDISFRPWKRGYAETLAGKFMGTFPYSKNSEREKTLYFSNVIYELEEHFFAKKSKSISYQKETDLTNLRICKPIGYNLFGLKELEDKGLISIASPINMTLCFKMLSSNRVDLVMTNKIAGWRYIEDLFIDTNEFTMLENSFVKIGHYLIIPKSNVAARETINKFNNALNNAKVKWAACCYSRKTY
ncbi:hypothetical protein GCM10007916_23190 [Psychromonas marina]|uniref:Solute-binding protein family 3/N-terminal domain-containing protein n=1 Tax=Psychromonas marina TaxID=88364 RepID=A0ABQ6E206_9GAMM|nr:transporter substrate-binding domain-containing protein [Psychromonas marina]GLS91250.1 hypothetical protein GCM10007916_23190 [Psychromonas marina]